MKRAFASLILSIWGLKSTDKNIDHRRVPNLQTFFKRRGASLADYARTLADYLPGDLITCTVAGRLPHIAIVVLRHGMAARRPGSSTTLARDRNVRTACSSFH
jgi:uncharacterized protein